MSKKIIIKRALQRDLLCLLPILAFQFMLMPVLYFLKKNHMISWMNGWIAFYLFILFLSLSVFCYLSSAWLPYDDRYFAGVPFKKMKMFFGVPLWLCGYALSLYANYCQLVSTRPYQVGFGNNALFVGFACAGLVYILCSLRYFMQFILLGLFIFSALLNYGQISSPWAYEIGFVNTWVEVAAAVSGAIYMVGYLVYLIKKWRM